MPDPASDRRRELARLVAERGFLRVADASILLGVSEVTVRADLARLEGEGTVARIHGGAVPAGSIRSESPLEHSVQTDASVKRAIGESAAALVAPGNSLMLDVGSTALAVAEALVRRTELEDVTVITNGLTVALALEPAHPRFRIVVIGGTLRPLQHSLVDPLAGTLLDQLHADLAVIGCNGVDVEGGVTNINLAEADVKRRMVARSERRVLVADASKLGRTHLGGVAPLAVFDTLVTGGDPPRAVIGDLERAGLDVLVAGEAGSLG
ncbi:DeoR family transcriptional regulator of aga operon [Diaminobutyricimonas aerilata]|uniref:DeoR family transcriptional regulator of aga operon n=1 Tax=Diaminobutyricimonas aerilata TaxID=1162967 RepID=A0A2M9CMH2_9MICO|nr:DeoR/GlpR family DNA-binding transcription regulator [Diaminobutyricimonas aerilata]PJJ73083.1 DeoR family transcriptional regulator of aga operon [Diaminobutyricimonas aerilata]